MRAERLGSARHGAAGDTWGVGWRRAGRSREPAPRGRARGGERSGRDGRFARLVSARPGSVLSRRRWAAPACVSTGETGSSPEPRREAETGRLSPLRLDSPHGSPRQPPPRLPQPFPAPFRPSWGRAGAGRTCAASVVQLCGEGSRTAQRSGSCLVPSPPQPARCGAHRWSSACSRENVCGELKDVLILLSKSSL